MNSITISAQRLTIINSSRIATVSVIERCPDGAMICHSFPDTALGNGHAGELFGKIASEQEVGGPNIRLFDDEDIICGLEDGRLEDGNGWSLEIVHSEVDDQPRLVESLR